MADLPQGTVTFLFTDIEGSTALWVRDHTAMPYRVRPEADAPLAEWSPAWLTSGRGQWKKCL